MKVTVSEKCSRCKRENQKDIDSTEISSLEQEAERRQEALEAIQAQIQEWPQDIIPDLLVYYRGEVRTFDIVCERFCHKTVTNHLDEVFRQIDPTKRKPRKKKENGKSAKDTEAAAATDETQTPPPQVDEKTADTEVQA